MRHSLILLLLAAGSPRIQEPSKTIEGIVRAVADSGAPVAGAEVRIGSRSATSNAEGRFRIDSVPFGDHAVVIRRIGFQPIRTRLSVYSTSQSFWEYFLPRAPFRLPDLSVEGRRTGIFGVVTDLVQRPMAGASVSAIGNRAGTVLTDSTGRFGFPDAVVGGYLVRVTRAGYAERRIMLNLERGMGVELSISMNVGRGRTVSHAEAAALFDLRRELAFGLRRDRMVGDELTRYGSLSVCDVPRVRIAAGRDQVGVLNGERRLAPGELCTWNVDEIAMIQFGGRSVFQRMPGESRLGGVIIWEKW